MSHLSCVDLRHFSEQTDPGSDRQYRMRVDLVVVVCVAAVAVHLPALSKCDPLYVMSAPNLLRVGTPETVFVEAQDYSGSDLNVRIKVLNYPSKTSELTSVSVMLTRANDYQLLTDITIKEEYFEEDDTMNQYVYLQAKFPGQQLEKKVLVSFQAGYIFVQTDKTIYTPSSTVFYRAFALSPSMKPKASDVSVEIMTPGGITIRKDVIKPGGGMNSGQYNLPEIVSFGTWKVVTRFADTPLRNFTAEFEVKEYVLPSFEVSLTLERSFFYVDDKEFEVDISARYLYGKEVNGHGFVVFGVMTSDKGKTSLAQSLRRVEIRRGKGKAILRREHITQTFPNINELVGSSIYVSVSVLTESGSEMVEAQRKGIPIVTSPYTIHFKRTPKYFKPGMPFDVSVLVTNPDSTPADRVDVEVMAAGKVVRGSTHSNGIVKFTINPEGGASNLPITVKTKSPDLSSARQARQTMTALPYQTQSGSRNYLHIGVASAELTVGEQVKVSLNLGGSPGAKNQDFTLLILSKGQLVQAKKIARKGRALLSFYLPVTKDMVPSFRIVAYYHVGSSEVVSDSVWVDVKDTCMGTLKVEATRSTVSYQPRQRFSLKITGDPGARVGLVAVDKGVYVLNNKHRLTQTKIWDVVEKCDTGCTAGSGKNNMGVFFDAGLIFQSSTAGGTGERNEPTCPKPAERRRRAITIQDLHNSLTGKYTGTERQCCVDGMKDNIMGFTCERRAEYVTDGDKCVQAFLHCCKEMSKKRKEAKDEELVLARSETEDYTASEDIVSRSEFPESWLWEDEDLPQCPAHDRDCATTSMTKTSSLKDSITTWEVTAVSISKTHGICVADPYEMIVVKDFFIDLRLPYSAVLEEQIEIKAILYNYRDDAIKVRLELMETSDVCSVATKKGKYLSSVAIGAMTSRAVPFTIVPMKLGKHTIEVKGAVFGSFLSDGIKKDLLVVAKGVLTEIPTKKIVLKPREHGGRQVERILSNLPARQVPGTPSNTIISLSAEQITLTVEKAISGHSMGSLIVQPRGCGEQNMVYMTLPVIATHYLDTTNQWSMVGLQKRATAINYINMGYQQELKYRKNDGGFAVWATYPTSSWLTAYVAKVFAMASDIIGIEERVICEAINWLVLNAQLPNGIFRETFRVYHAEMVGGVKGLDSEASMTAFVLISMQEGKKLCIHRVNSLSSSINRATQYLEGRLRTLTNPYAIAMVSYALANEGRLNQEVLFRHASSDRTHWPVHGNGLFTLEATAYALLALVKVKEFKKAGPIVTWLNSQQRSGGGYGSTQATIMVFQAVAAYSAQASAHKQELNLNVHIQPSDPTRNKPIQWTFTKKNKFQTQSSKMDLDQDLTVTASGTGEATLTVTSLYYAMPTEKESDCKMFKVDVNLERAKSSGEGTIETYKLVIDFMFLSKERPSTMAILDIGLPTGFSVDESDLTRLSTGADKYIQRFEMDKMLSDRGSLIIYLDQVSNTRPDRVAFRLHKVMNVGLLQPASVTMYEYLDMDKRCVKFYHPSKEKGMLKRICEKDLCKCAEEPCSTRKMEKIESKERWDWVCQRSTDFVYKFTVNSKDLTINIDVYNVRIDEVIKAGDDDVDEELDSKREFSAYPVCRDMLALEVGKTYFIMGHKKDYLGGKKYLMSYNTWLEYWPTKEEAKTQTKYKDVYEEIAMLSADISTFGC